MSDIVFHSIKEAPFEIFGLSEPRSADMFRRMPYTVAEATSPAVLTFHTNTAGGRIRFKTNSDELYIRAKDDGTPAFYHTTPLLLHGYDVYLDGGREPQYLGAVHPIWTDELEKLTCFKLPEGENEITVNMPLFGNVIDVEIGLCRGAAVSSHTPYKHHTPVVFYGSSITQGACASRPGRCYESLISRKYDLNYINLGFSGACKAEDAIVDYLTTLEMSAFVSDYDHNCNGPEHLSETHWNLYRKIREKHPDIPYFMITKPDFRFDENDQMRRAVIMENYLKAYFAGDRNVYFIDGSAFFNGRPTCELTMDLTHPNDEGMAKMADYIGDVLSKVMKL